MTLTLTTVMQLLQMAPQVIGLGQSIAELVKHPSVVVKDSTGQVVSPAVIADLVSVATDSAIKGVQAAG